MNEKFYSLPPEKQQNIINAGYRVFSRNSYKKSPMSEIADAAGISKSLLFHYFRNKKELYLFLWGEGARVTIEYMTKYGCYEPAGLFDMMERGMRAKLQIMHQYPDMAAFVIRAFYEKNPEVCGEIQKSYQKALDFKANKAKFQLNPDEFIPGIDLNMMYREMYWAAEGYLWEAMQHGPIDAERLEADFSRMIEFWKTIYCRKKNMSAGEDHTDERH